MRLHSVQQTVIALEERSKSLGWIQCCVSAIWFHHLFFLALHPANGMRKIYQIHSLPIIPLFFFLPANRNSLGCLSFGDVYSDAAFHASPHRTNKLYI